MCYGDPKVTDTARCLTANYSKSLMSHRKAERSGVLLIQEATQKGYAEAEPGDSVNLGYVGSKTLRGRVGKDIAHTLGDCRTQGVVMPGFRIRRLTPRECLRLQGFTEDQIDKVLAITSDSQAYKQAGNSVTVNVIFALGLRIKAMDHELKAGDAP
jgi:DNA (cytosine-5)-methyltransferase 1